MFYIASYKIFIYSPVFILIFVFQMPSNFAYYAVSFFIRENYCMFCTICKATTITTFLLNKKLTSTPRHAIELFIN